MIIYSEKSIKTLPSLSDSDYGCRVNFFKISSAENMHENKYKNTFHSQNEKIDQYIQSRDIFTKKLGSYEKSGGFSVILHNNSMKHCFITLD